MRLLFDQNLSPHLVNRLSDEYPNSVEELRRELALHLFEQGTLSVGEARKLVEGAVWEFR